MLKIAELRFTIRADLKKLTSDIQGLLKKKFKIGVDTTGGGAAAGAGVGGKKGIGLLGGILKALGPLAVLLSLKPIADLVSIMLNFIVLSGIAIIKLFKGLIDKIVEIAPKVWGFLKNLFKVSWDFLKGLPSGIWKLLKIGFNFLKEKLGLLKDAFVQKIIDLKDRVVEFFKSLPGRIKEFFVNLGVKIVELKERLKEKLGELKDEISDKLGELKDKFKEKVDELKDKFKDKIDELKERLALLLEGLPEKIWGFIKGLGQLIADKLQEVLPKFLGGNGDTSVTDAIIKPDGTIIRTDPRDTIIATQNPGGLGGGHTFIFNGVTEQRMINEVKRQLGSDQIRASRF